MARCTAVRLAVVLSIHFVLASHPAALFAVTAVWLDIANGQGRDCDGLAGFEFFWPDNNLWSQQQVLGTDPCGNPNAILEPSNWNGPLYPDNNNGSNWDVILDAPANTVLDVPVEIDTLTVESDGRLDVLGGSNLSLVGGSLVNDSTIIINSDDGPNTVLSLFFPTETLLSGSGTIVMNRGDAGAWIASGSPVTQAAGHTIRGKGRISAWLTNNGIIEAADTAGGGSPVLLMTIGGGQTNNNIIRATSGATLRIESLVITQDSATGRLIGDGPGILGLGNVELGDGAHIVDGRLEGDIDITDGTVTLENVANVSNTINSIPNTTTIIRGPNFTNNGTFNVTSPVFNQFTNLKFATDTLLTGSGELALGQFNAVRVSADAGVTVTNDTGHTIGGQGKWFVPLVNNGMVEGLSLSFENTAVENNVTMETRMNGGLVFLNTTVTQDPTNGMLRAGTGGAVNLTGATVINGVLEDTPSPSAFSGFRVNNALLVNVRNQARINILFGTRLRVEGAVFINDGPITVNNDSLTLGTSIEFQDDVLLDGSGEIWLNEPGLGAQLKVVGGGMLTQAATHTIRGSGRIDASLFINHGTVDNVPLINAQIENYGSMNGIDQVNGDVLNDGILSGRALNPADLNGLLTGSGQLAYIQINGVHKPGSSPVGLTVNGSYLIGSTGTLAIEIGGLVAGSEHDQVDVIVDPTITTGAVRLDGTLAAELIDAGSGYFVPNVGDMFTVLTADADIVGTFTAFDLPKTAGGRGLTWRVHHNLRDVTLELLFALSADYNGNGVVDAADYTVWRDLLGQAGDGLAADGSGPTLGVPDGVVDQFDYEFWESNFGNVVSGAAADALTADSTAVPEPATFVTAMLALLTIVGTRMPRGQMSGVAG